MPPLAPYRQAHSVALSSLKSIYFIITYIWGGCKYVYINAVTLRDQERLFGPLEWGAESCEVNEFRLSSSAGTVNTLRLLSSPEVYIV